MFAIQCKSEAFTSSGMSVVTTIPANVSPLFFQKTKLLREKTFPEK